MSYTKGQSGKTIEIIITLMLGIIVAAIAIQFLIPAITSTKSAGTCGGPVRKIASLVANQAGLVIC